MAVKEYVSYLSLIAVINHHMDCYYNQDSPEISDYEYDKLMQTLKETEKEHPDWITKDSPTQKIGEDTKRSMGVKIKHTVPMLSIKDVFDTKDVTY